MDTVADGYLNQIKERTNLSLRKNEHLCVEYKILQ